MLQLYWTKLNLSDNMTLQTDSETSKTIPFWERNEGQT